ncbi:hypothetical protein DFH07DRAFT_513347 [Mycena maculata]|uniref:BTB domain-containing protein n=1 Tax=Mycena maculata TaxID=230809 RepID=A0AAD7J069_9AGAR|nr:hypothetical protein DFH07DRAFT_513347 [Mycena maculata]
MMHRSFKQFFPFATVDVDNTPTRVESLWFSDGSLVLQAENSLFRVSGAVLAARSPVFKDMLAFPQPADAETIDGCPVVRLPDSATEVTHFLRALFDSSFFEPFPAKPALTAVVSILRLGNKYAVDYLRRRALVHLSSGFSTTLSHYDQDDENRGSVPEIYDSEYSGLVLAIQTSRKVAALWILPSAFYYLAAARDDRIQRVLDCAVHESHPANLSPADQIVFLKSSLQISRAVPHTTRFLHAPPIIPGCTGGEGCLAARLRAVGKVQTAAAGHSLCAADPLGICSGRELLEDLEDACCRACCQFSEQANAEARQEFWDQLPGICGLPPWEELEKMKEEALEA